MITNVRKNIDRPPADHMDFYARTPHATLAGEWQLKAQFAPRDENNNPTTYARTLGAPAPPPSTPPPLQPAASSRECPQGSQEAYETGLTKGYGKGALQERALQESALQTPLVVLGKASGKSS